MSEKSEPKSEMSKSKFLSSLINRLQNCKKKIKQTIPLEKSKTKNLNTEFAILEERSNSVHSKADVCDSINKKKYSSLNDDKSSKLCEDHILQKYDEVKDSLKEHLKSQNVCIANSKEIEATVSVQSAITPTIPKDEVNWNNMDTDKSLNTLSKSKTVSLLGDRSIKLEPVDEFKNSERLVNGDSICQNITCLENLTIKDEEADKVNYKLKSESEDEDIIDRGPVKTHKNKERHSEYPLQGRDQETAVPAIPQRATFPIDIEALNLDIELERIIADIEIENRIKKIEVDKKITNFLCDLLGPNTNFFQCTDSSSNSAINSQQLKTDARCKLFISEHFSEDVFFELCSEMYTWIQKQDFVSSNDKVIHYLKLYGRKKYRRTNLHDAVMKENLEETLCILEIHKWYHNDLFEINAKDSSNPKKTALDWAYETRNCLLIDYLKENLATRAVYVTPINAPGT